jgi:hypothetical protein
MDQTQFPRLDGEAISKNPGVLDQYPFEQKAYELCRERHRV